MVKVISKLKEAALHLAILSLVTACHTVDPVDSAVSTIFESYYEAVRTSITEPHRAKALVELGRELEPQLSHEIRQLHRFHEEIAELNADYDSSRRELDNQLDIIQQQRQSMRAILLAALPQFVELTTPEEWSRLQQRSNTLIGWLTTEVERV